MVPNARSLTLLLCLGLFCAAAFAQDGDGPKVKAPDRLEEFTTTRNEAEKLKAKWASAKKNEAKAAQDAQVRSQREAQENAQREAALRESQEKEAQERARVEAETAARERAQQEAEKAAKDQAAREAAERRALEDERQARAEAERVEAQRAAAEAERLANERAAAEAQLRARETQEREKQAANDRLRAQWAAEKQREGAKSQPEVPTADSAKAVNQQDRDNQAAEARKVAEERQRAYLKAEAAKAEKKRLRNEASPGRYVIHHSSDNTCVLEGMFSSAFRETDNTFRMYHVHPETYQVEDLGLARANVIYDIGQHSITEFHGIDNPLIGRASHIHPEGRAAAASTGRNPSAPADEEVLL